MRILIVDDDESFREFIASILRVRYPLIEVQCACDGENALKIASEGNVPAIVLTDIMMPKLNGIRLCHSLKDVYRGSVKVVGMSAGLRPIDPAFDATLSKPFNLDLLYKIIDDSLRDIENQINNDE
jgi:CheY-like chemotaxis protein